jgi:hypothetical protein
MHLCSYTWYFCRKVYRIDYRFDYFLINLWLQANILLLQGWNSRVDTLEQSHVHTFIGLYTCHDGCSHSVCVLRGCFSQNYAKFWVHAHECVYHTRTHARQPLCIVTVHAVGQICMTRPTCSHAQAYIRRHTYTHIHTYIYSVMFAVTQLFAAVRGGDVRIFRIEAFVCGVRRMHWSNKVKASTYTSKTFLTTFALLLMNAPRTLDMSWSSKDLKQSRT